MAKDTANKKENKEKKDNKNFFKEFKAELKRVSWPTLKQLVNNTTVVVAIVVLVAVIVFVLDVIFENLNNFGVEKLKVLVTSSSSENIEETDDANVSEEQNVEDGTEINELEVTEDENSVENTEEVNPAANEVADNTVVE